MSKSGELVLEKLRVYVQTKTDMYTLASTLSIEQFECEMYDAMLTRLKGYVLANEVDKKTTQVTFEVAVPATWWDHLKEDLFPEWLKEKFPVRWQVIIKRKKVTVRRLATFPYASIVLPKEFGNTIIYKHQWNEEDL